MNRRSFPASMIGQSPHARRQSRSACGLRSVCVLRCRWLLRTTEPRLRLRPSPGCSERETTETRDPCRAVVVPFRLTHYLRARDPPPPRLSPPLRHHPPPSPAPPPPPPP